MNWLHRRELIILLIFANTYNEVCWLLLILRWLSKALCNRFESVRFLVFLHVLDEFKCFIHVLSHFLFFDNIEDLLALLIIRGLWLGWRLLFETWWDRTEWSKLIPYRKFLVQYFKFFFKIRIIWSRPWSLIMLLNSFCHWLQTNMKLRFLIRFLLLIVFLIEDTVLLTVLVLPRIWVLNECRIIKRAL